ncbi:uncharacterized protein LOC132280832 [Cornus florida]|uniref:uncharacterized protein LOC132280832 n=1 Tax=Cornus florida TaxID=4283 RepID=UPI00289883B1|nr:uncharacterized protein LOC132280832 [Cornus florida]
MTTAIRILVYGCVANHCDEYIKISESTAIETLMTFCKVVVAVYVEEYMCSPNEADITRLLREGEERGFLSIPSSIDYWWIWHAFFGMLGSHNDINVLDHSSVFDSTVTCQIPLVNFVVNGHYYRMGYYLSDGIYPKWTTLMQTIPHPTTAKEKLFAQRQEACWKDVE